MSSNIISIMKITVAGMAGSGKSTIAKILASKLGFKHYSAGDAQRALAEELKVSIEELGRLESTDDKYDRMIDQKVVDFGKEHDNVVFDGWLSANFVPDAFKVFLDIDIEEAVVRRMKQDARSTEKYGSVDEAKELMLRRQEVNRLRWIEFYDFDYTNKDNYNLVIDTTDKPIDKIVDIVLDKINEFKISTTK